MDSFEYKVDEGSVGARLDVFISNKFENKSRSYIQGIIEGGAATVDGKCRKSNYKLKLDARVTLIHSRTCRIKRCGRRNTLRCYI